MKQNKNLQQAILNLIMKKQNLKQNSVLCFIDLRVLKI